MFHDSNNNLTLFFKKPFIIWGKVFRACYAKEDNIFLYRTNESYPFGSSTIPGRLSFEEFIEWQNPIQHNSRQVVNSLSIVKLLLILCVSLQLMTKWSTRTTLGFSNSVPGPRIRQNLVREIDDISMFPFSTIYLILLIVHTFSLWNGLWDDRWLWLGH